MSAREEALISEGRKLHNAWFDGPDMEQRDRMIRMAKVAREIHQPRTITTVEELDALPEHSVVRSDEGAVWESDSGVWYETASRLLHVAADIALPATVLYTPKES